MKAISLKQPWASWIAQGRKTIETRRWYTRHRGPLLICASKQPKINGLPTGKALCIVTVVDCRPMTKEDETAAICVLYPGAYAWLLADVKPIEPFPVKGSLGLYDVPLLAEAEK